MIRIAFDAMGGDSGPEVNVKGAIDAARETGFQITLTGDQERIKKKLADKNTGGLNIKIQHASQVIEMEEKPTEACRSKKDSSIMIAAKIVSEGNADALVSAGNSGATMAAALMHMKRIPGVHRPAIATLMPTLCGNCVLVDVGANVDCKAKNLYQFAIMGAIYAKNILHLPSPKIGLLSIGEEEGKGNELTSATHEMLKNSGLNYIGNVEGGDIPKGKADVIVCDGFIGNALLKFGEGLASFILAFLKEERKRHPMTILGLPFMRGILYDIKKRVDYSEYGGAPLLGVNGPTIICHGGSNAKAIKNAIRVAGELCKTGADQLIKEELHKFHADSGGTS